ncbi:conserved hypothetical protein [Candidatus Roizmanbacteria bacterium]|nr:conserved hypothetical protein [Candidatus Roizmanbacteria bacterium]
MKKEIIYAFIDASNIIYGARSEGWFIDQKKLFIYLKNKFKISKAFFYYGKDSNDPKKIAFLNKLETFGYILRVKEIKRFGKRMKANCDVDLTMDMLIKIMEYDKAIVLTGDGDFAPLFIYLIKNKKQIVIISSPKRTAKEIRIIAGENHIDFGSLRYFIEFFDHKKGGRP